ncbi:hypothetical protein OBV_12480 [Oscillibacter valericigenes Sjm18-20]|nr:hypothetical protein OBV_12480 [Oscillibacter valericigenes Sjm18-20]
MNIATPNNLCPIRFFYGLNRVITLASTAISYLEIILEIERLLLFFSAVPKNRLSQQPKP